MITKKQDRSAFRGHVRFAGPFLVAMGLLVSRQANALGSWATVAQAPPNGAPVQHMLLLPDGTVMAQRASLANDVRNEWYRLTPVNGSYLNGSWSTLQSMHDTRQFFSSVVLQDGRVFVAGGEYGSGIGKAEIYDYVSNTWTPVNPPASLLDPTQPWPGNPGAYNQGFADAESIILANGNVLIAPVLYKYAYQTLIYDPHANAWSAGPDVQENQDEATWVKLPDDSILTINPTSDPNFLNTSERYIPSSNLWINDDPLPLPMYNSATEIGAGLLLPSGKVLFIGGLGHTAYYTPSGNNTHGSWAPGPDLLDHGVGWDEPASMMVNGKVLIQTTCTTPPNPHYCYYELDPVSNIITPAADWGDTSGSAHIMLTLPDGTVLVSNGSSTLHIYQPDGVPHPAGKPTISSITALGNGSYHLTGTKLNGISQGSSFGDDAQMDSNYPLVRISDGSGHVYYLPTYNWSSTGVNTGTKQVSTEFFAFQGLTPGLPYSLVVVANGFSSDPVTFYGPVWVDFNSINPVITGSYDFPYHTMAQAIAAVPSTGTINVKTAGHTPETPSTSKPMTIVAVGGPATIGR